MADNELPTTFEVAEVAVPSESENPFTGSEDSPPISSGELACIVCGTPLTYGGRGPKPKYCADHRKSGKSTGAASGGAGLVKIERLMYQRYIDLSTVVMMLDPAAALIIQDRADGLAHQWAVLAESNPKVKKALLSASDGMGWTGVIIGHAMLGLAIMNAHDYEPPFIRNAKERFIGKLSSE